MKHASTDRATIVGAVLLGALALAAALLVAALLGPRKLEAQDAADRGAFLLRRGADTLVVERFSRSADSLVGTLSVRGQPRMEYVAVLGPMESVRTLSLIAFRELAPPEEGPVRRILITMRGDSAIADVDGAPQRFATKAGALPFFNNSLALFELFVRRARAAGDSAEMPAFALSGGMTVPATIRAAGPDSLIATIAGQEQRLRADATGRILGGTIPAARIEILRVSAEDAIGLKVARVSYAPPEGAPYTAEEVALKGPGGIPLGGTLTIPQGAGTRVPAVVTITGSGQQDRDEFIPVAGGYRPFRQIADTLGRRGIAVLRLDDRTVGASGGKPGTSADYAEDVRAALAYLRTRAEIDPARLGVLGHSEGGLIGPMVASAEPALKAMVILAGPAENGLSIIRYQQRWVIDRDSTIAPAKRDSAYRAAALALDSMVAASPWLKFFVSYDPLGTARRVKTPALILHGETDRQVTAEQAEQLGAAMRAGGNRDVTVRVFPQLNHLFIHDPDGSPTGYGRLRTNRMDPGVLGAIADWLAIRLSASTSR